MKLILALAVVILVVAASVSAVPVGEEGDVDSHVVKDHVMVKRQIPFLGGGSQSHSQASSFSESGSIGGNLGPLGLGISGSKSGSQSSAGSSSFTGGFI